MNRENKSQDDTTKRQNREKVDVVSKPSERVEKKSKKSNHNIWIVKVFILTFLLTIFFMFLSDLTITPSSLIVAILIVLLIIVINIIFDAIAVAVTSCEIAPILAMSARKVPGSKKALSLVKNADRVSSICGDVIGDICGIVSGASSTVIVAKILLLGPTIGETIFTILVSSIVAAITVGGKAIGKRLAITHSREIVMFTAKVLSVFGEGKR